MTKVTQKIETPTSPWNRDQLNALPTTSAKIRFLIQYETRSEIAKILNIRYQHVRNVLKYELKKS